MDVSTGNKLEFGTCNVPRGLAADGTNIWVACAGTGMVIKIRRDHVGKLASDKEYPVGKGPRGIAYDGADIWVTNFGDTNNPGKSVAKINVETEAISEYAVDNYPSAIAFDGASMWVACGNSVVNLSLEGATLGKYATGNVPTRLGSGVAFDGANVWVTDWTNNRILKY